MLGQQCGTTCRHCNVKRPSAINNMSARSAYRKGRKEREGTSTFYSFATLASFAVKSWRLLSRRCCVISCAMPYLIGPALRVFLIEFNLDALEGRIRNSASGIESNQVLRPQLIAALAESFVQF